MDEEILLLRAKEERDKIFEKYDKERQSDNTIEPWEDPALEVYHRTDKFGFIHNDRFSSTNNKVNNNYYDRNIELGVIREKKWIQMLRHWNKSETQDKLRRRYKGILNKLR